MTVIEFNSSTIVEITNYIEAKSRRLMHDRELDRLRLFYLMNVQLTEKIKNPSLLYVLPGETYETTIDDNEDEINEIFEKLL